MDSLGQRFRQPVPQERHGELNTFVVFNRRRRVTSSAKRRRAPGSLHLAQTPDGSFLDLQRNAADLLTRCGFFRVPEVGLGNPCWLQCALRREARRRQRPGGQTASKHACLSISTPGGSSIFA